MQVCFYCIGSVLGTIVKLIRHFSGGTAWSSYKDWTEKE